MAHGEQHHLEFGGSPVSTEFPGKLQFKLVDRIPVIAVSHTFNEETARQVRYELVATVGPERPFYQRYFFIVLDLRMVSAWGAGGGAFVDALRQRMQSLGGELFIVATTDIPVSAAVPRFEAQEDAIAAAKDARARHRAAQLQTA